MDLTHATAALASLIKYLEVTLILDQFPKKQYKGIFFDLSWL